jgi:predicted restriction endonuclease
VSVTDVYHHRCSVTGEKTLPILDAAHIRPFGQGGEHEINNGLLLRTDIHRLFDLGYVTVSTDGRFEVGRRLKEDFENGRHYYEMRGKPLFLDEFFRGLEDENTFSGAGEFTGSVDYLMCLAGAAGSGAVFDKHGIPIE